MANACSLIPPAQRDAYNAVANPVLQAWQGLIVINAEITAVVMAIPGVNLVLAPLFVMSTMLMIVPDLVTRLIVNCDPVDLMKSEAKTALQTVKVWQQFPPSLKGFVPGAQYIDKAADFYTNLLTDISMGKNPSLSSLQSMMNGMLQLGAMAATTPDAKKAINGVVDQGKGFLSQAGVPAAAVGVLGGVAAAGISSTIANAAKGTSIVPAAVKVATPIVVAPVVAAMPIAATSNISLMGVKSAAVTPTIVAAVTATEKAAAKATAIDDMHAFNQKIALLYGPEYRQATGLPADYANDAVFRSYCDFRDQGQGVSAALASSGAAPKPAPKIILPATVATTPVSMPGTLVTGVPVSPQPPPQAASPVRPVAPPPVAADAPSSGIPWGKVAIGAAAVAKILHFF